MGVMAETRAFLEKSTLSLFIDSKKQNLSTLTEYSTIAQAMELLASKHIMSVPVLDQDGEYTGCVSVGDILKGLTKDLVEALGPHYAENIAEVPADKLKEVGEDFEAKSVRSILHDGDLWLQGDPTTSLMDVILKGFNIQERQIHHRIYVCDPAKATRTSIDGRTTVVNIAPGSEALDASGWKPTDVVSQLDMVIVLAQHKEVLSAIATKSLADIEAFVGTEQTVKGDVPALEAFHTMAVDHKSTLGIVDDAGKLVGNLSVSDLRYLPAGAFDLLLRPVAEYVALVHGKGPSLQEAAAGARVEGAAEGEWRIVLEGTPLVTLLPSATFEDLLDAFVKHRAHRVHVVDEEGRPVSIITLTDVLRMVTRVPKPEQIPLARPVQADEEEEEADE